MGLFTGFRGPVNAILTMLLLLGNGLQCQASFGCQKTHMVQLGHQAMLS